MMKVVELTDFVIINNAGIIIVLLFYSFFLISNYSKVDSIKYELFLEKFNTALLPS